MAARRLELPALRRLSYKVYLFLAVLALMLALVVHSNTMIARLNEETRSRADVMARFFAVATFQAVEDPSVRPLFQEAVRSINFPIVLTDREGIPRAWKEIGIDPDLVPDSLLVRAAETGEVAPVVARIQEIVRRLDQINRPVPIRREDAPGVIGFVHYGEPKLVRELRWLPWIELLVILILLVFGYAGLRNLLLGEQRSLWAALAKETAHQLGTPLSSLLGWSALLRSESEAGPVSAERVREIVDEVDRDLGRLQKVTHRFGQVGSMPVLQEGDLTEVLASAVDYFRSRLPHLGREVSMVERYEPVPRVRFHRELIEWVVENLLRNAIDAIDKPRGVIEVALEWKRDEREIAVTVRDNGRGMSPEERRRAFEAGFTTKRRGWGLGLALASRVVREYHEGRIAIVESVPGRGTAVQVTLPVPPLVSSGETGSRTSA
ncbi:MAG TPA: HAMP domain-containing sensor histidine kinase [Candidatus Eisenbacteria bacterium]|nr:HAMP domain-containing sensor histidine kinase [Candidatus Eisenbacteria bacterium]